MFCLYKDEASVHYFFPAEMLIIAKTYKKKDRRTTKSQLMRSIALFPSF